MGRMIRKELKIVLLRFRVVFAIVCLSAVYLIVAIPYRKAMILTGGSTEGSAWICTFIYSISSGNALMFLPFLASLAAGKLLEEELHSRYALFLVNRMGKKKYIIVKVAGVILAGGITVLASMIITLFVSYLGCRGIPDLGYTSEIIESNRKVFFILFVLCRGFLNGAFWSVVGVTIMVITKNQYLNYAVPFIVYYVLTVFQERYYKEFYYLSPRQWAYPTNGKELICIITILILMIFMTAKLIQTVNRRLSR